MTVPERRRARSLKGGSVRVQYGTNPLHSVHRKRRHHRIRRHGGGDGFSKGNRGGAILKLGFPGCVFWNGGFRGKDPAQAAQGNGLFKKRRGFRRRLTFHQQSGRRDFHHHTIFRQKPLHIGSGSIPDYGLWLGRCNYLPGYFSCRNDGSKRSGRGDCFGYGLASCIGRASLSSRIDGFSYLLRRRGTTCQPSGKNTCGSNPETPGFPGEKKPCPMAHHSQFPPATGYRNKFAERNRRRRIASGPVFSANRYDL